MGRQLSEESLHGLIALGYEAAVEPSCWPAFMACLAKLLDAPAASMWVHDFGTGGVAANGDGETFRAVGFEPSYMQSYAEHYTHKNVWARNESNLAEGIAVTSEMLYPQQQLSRTEFYADWLRPQGLAHALGGIVSLSGNLATKVSILRSESLGVFSDEEIAFYRRLMPHLKRACIISQRLASERASHAICSVAGQWAAGSTHLGLLTLTPAGHVLSTNARGEALLCEARWLVCRDGSLQGGTPAQTRQVHAALRQTAATLRPQHFTLAGPAGNDHCCVSMLPAQGCLNGDGNLRPCVLCVLAGFGGRRRIAPALQLMDLFSFTPAEARVARAIARGERLNEYAEGEGIKPSTAKTLLLRAFHKLGIGSQNELIQKLLALPAVRGEQRAMER